MNQVTEEHVFDTFSTQMRASLTTALKWGDGKLYDWLKWFDEHKFKVETGTQPVDKSLGALAFLMNQHVYVRLVRGS